MQIAWTVSAILVAFGVQTATVAAAGLADVAFLEGAWRGDSEGLVFEEIWSGPEGDVMTGMARGVKNGRTTVLEYIILSERSDGLEMRFKHFRPDYTTWETDSPVVLKLTKVSPGDALFTALETEADVRSIRYFMLSEETLQADVVLAGEEAQSGFSLTFQRVE